MPTPPNDELAAPTTLTPDEVLISRAVRELLATGGFGTVVLTFKNNVLEELQVSYTRKAKLERAAHSGQRPSD